MSEHSTDCRARSAAGGISLLLTLAVLSGLIGCSVRVTPTQSGAKKPEGDSQPTVALAEKKIESQQPPERLADKQEPEKPTTGVAEAKPAQPNAAAPDSGSSKAGTADSDRSIEQLASVAVGADRTDSKPKRSLTEGRTRDVTFDTIKFEMDKEEPFQRSMITPAIEKLFGTRIRIRGFILPASAFEGSELTGFVLVRDNLECCFGPGAALYDCIVVEMSPGTSARFTNHMISIEGVLSLDEIKDPGDEQRHLAIYHMVADKVK